MTGCQLSQLYLVSEGAFIQHIAYILRVSHLMYILRPVLFVYPIGFVGVKIGT